MMQSSGYLIPLHGALLPGLQLRHPAPCSRLGTPEGSACWGDADELKPGAAPEAGAGGGTVRQPCPARPAACEPARRAEGGGGRACSGAPQASLPSDGGSGRNFKRGSRWRSGAPDSSGLRAEQLPRAEAVPGALVAAAPPGSGGEAAADFTFLTVCFPQNKPQHSYRKDRIMLQILAACEETTCLFLHLKSFWIPPWEEILAWWSWKIHSQSWSWEGQEN